MDQIELPVEKEYVKSAWHLYIVRLKDQPKVEFKRRNIFNYLRKCGIGAQVHYIPVYLHPYYRRLGYKEGLCPKAERFYQREISIPLYPSIKDSELKYVDRTLKDAIDKYV
jgi:dTDP-4-amino-4,6-dideoxygalactose transaminase